MCSVNTEWRSLSSEVAPSLFTEQIICCKTEQREKLVKIFPVLHKSCPAPFPSPLRARDAQGAAFQEVGQFSEGKLHSSS